MTEERDLLGAVAQRRKEITPDRMDISFNELINMYKDGELKINPAYQRFFRWNDDQKTAFIESLLLSIPIPPIFVAEDMKTGLWELVDGLQRISTILSFFGELSPEAANMTLEADSDKSNFVENSDDSNLKNPWILTSGRLLPELEGYDITTLPNNLKINLKRASCRVEILRGESSHTMKYELFRRLNSGGSPLTAQEVRNAIFRGTNSSLNQFLEDAVAHENFKVLTKLTVIKIQEMYDQELVLRYLAFSHDSNVNENTEKALTTFMESMCDSEFNSGDELNKFIRVIDLIHSLNDMNIFRNERKFFVPAWFEGITVAISNNIEIFSDNPKLLQERISMLKKDEEFRRLSGSASNSRSRVKRRLKRALEIFDVESN